VHELVHRSLERCQATNQMGLHQLQLLHVQQAWAALGWTPGRGDREPGVLGFEPCEDPLQDRDVGAQLPPARPPSILTSRGPGLNVQGGCDLTRVDPRLVGLAGGCGGDGPHGGRSPRGGSGNVGAAALVTFDQALLLEALVDGAYGVDVDLQCLGEIPQAGEALPQREATVVDARAQRPRQLHPNRDLCPAIDREVETAHTPIVRLALHILTVATRARIYQSTSELEHWYIGSMTTAVDAAGQEQPRQRPWIERALLERALHPAGRALEEVGDMVLLTGRTVSSALRGPYPYGGELVAQFLFVLRLCWLPLLVSTVCINYAVPGMEGANFLTLSGAPDRLGGIFTLAAIREIGPFVTAVVVAGAAGTAITADLGARKIREELDALQVLGVDPVKNLIVPRFLALMLATGLFNAYAILFGLFGGVLAELINGQPLGPFWDTLFANADTTDLWGSALKATAYGAIIAIICCYKGMTASGGAEGVGRAVNQAVVLAFLAFGTFDFVFTQALLATHPQILVIK
jgi:phospholipid/cholesterol/gamma-HCH transport system permease protein